MSMTKLSLCEGLAQHMGLTDLRASEYLYHALEALAVAGVEVKKKPIYQTRQQC